MEDGERGQRCSGFGVRIVQRGEDGGLPACEALFYMLGRLLIELLDLRDLMDFIDLMD